MKVLFLLLKKWSKSIDKIEILLEIDSLRIDTALEYNSFNKEFYDFLIVDSSVFLDQKLFFIYEKVLRNYPFLIVSNDEIELECKDIKGRFLGYLDLNANIISTVSYLKNVSSKIENKRFGWNRRFINIFSIGVVIRDKYGNLISLNPAAEKILGITQNQAMGKLSMNPSWHALDEEGLFVNEEELPSRVTLRTKEKIIGRVLGLYSDNGELVKWIKVTTVPSFINGELDIVYSHFEDITENIERHEFMELLISTFKYSPISLVITDHEGVIQLINPKFEEISGYKNKDIIGKNPRILKDVDSTTNFKELWETISSGKVWHGEFLNIDANGNKYSEEAIISPIRNKFNKITHFLGLKTDVTDLRRVKLKLENTLANFENIVDERTASLNRAQKMTLESLAILTEYRDNETGAHIQRTKYYMKLILEKLKGKINYNNQEIEQMWNSAPLHDIGKVAIRDSILLKSGKLTDEEFNIMKKHVIYGNQVLSSVEDKNNDIGYLKFAKEITLYHHEWWNGSGYPEGLSGTNIPFSARVMTLSDVYDALRSKRPYKVPFSHEEAVRIIAKESGIHFDPMLVEVFLGMHLEFDNIFKMYLD